MCFGGGGGGGGTTQFNWNDTLAPKWDQLLKDATSKAYGNAYQQYPDQRIADLSPDQTTAMNMLRNNVANNGVPAEQNANMQLQQTLTGSYLGPQGNPYQGANSNPYAGNNSPYFRETMNQGLQDITNNYMNTVSPETTRMFNQAGAFGGSAYQKQVANNQFGLAGQLQRYTSGMQNEQYNRSAQLAEGGVNRGSSAYENERQRQIQAISGGQHAQDQFYQGVQQLMGVGDISRSFSQDQINQAYNDWLASKNQDFKNADWLSGIYGRAQGGMAPNSQTQTSGYSASPYSTLLGAGLLGKAFGAY